MLFVAGPCWWIHHWMLTINRWWVADAIFRSWLTTMPPLLPKPQAGACWDARKKRISLRTCYEKFLGRTDVDILIPYSHGNCKSFGAVGEGLLFHLANIITEKTAYELAHLVVVIGFTRVYDDTCIFFWEVRKMVLSPKTMGFNHQMLQFGMFW